MLVRATQRLMVVALVVLLALLLGGCAQQTSQAAKKVTFMAGFRPQANLPFLATYVAKEKGFYQQQGLDVDIQHATSGEHYRLLAGNQVQFTTAPAEDVLKQSLGDPSLPFVAVALIGHKGDRGWAVLKSSGITSPKQWEGKKVGYKVLVPPDLLAIMRAAGVDQQKVNLVSVGFDPRVLVDGQVDVFQVFTSNEPNLIRKMGQDVTVFHAADYGIPTLGLTYITNREMVDKDPDTVRRFLKATLRGLAYALDNPDEALDILAKYAPQADRDHMRFMMEAERPSAVTELTRANGLGWMTEGQWKALYDTLREYQALARPGDFKQAYTTRFLEDVYNRGKLKWP